MLDGCKVSPSVLLARLNQPSSLNLSSQEMGPNPLNISMLSSGTALAGAHFSSVKNPRPRHSTPGEVSQEQSRGQITCWHRRHHSSWCLKLTSNSQKSMILIRPLEQQEELKGKRDCSYHNWEIVYVIWHLEKKDFNTWHISRCYSSSQKFLLKKQTSVAQFWLKGWKKYILVNCLSLYCTLLCCIYKEARIVLVEKRSIRSLLSIYRQTLKLEKRRTILLSNILDSLTKMQQREKEMGRSCNDCPW